MNIGVPFTDRIKSSLGSAGVVGFFAEDVATLAIMRTTVCEDGKLLACNMPGSYDLSKRFRLLANSKFSDTYPTGPNVDPTVVLQDGIADGPMYRAIESGTILTRTSPVARLLLEECAEFSVAEGVRSRGRWTTPVGVTIVELHHAPKAISHPTLRTRVSGLMDFLPLAASAAASAACVLKEDWVSFGVISLGVLTSAIASATLSSGVLTFDHPIAASGAPSGDGLLIGDRDVVILKGEEDAVNSVTRSRFSLHFNSEFAYKMLGVSSALYGVQFLAQLLLVPQGTLYGQAMFLGSVAASWLYSSHIASRDNGKVLRRVLMESVLRKPDMRKYILGTRTAMVVFAMLVLKPEDLEKQMNELLPNDTRVWRLWKETILGRLKSGEKLASLKTNTPKLHDDWDMDEISLVRNLFEDAAAAEETYEDEAKYENQNDEAES